VLVLSRHRDSAIQVGADITITVLEIHKGRVRLGIDAPNQVLVRRSQGSPHVCRAPANPAIDAPPPAKATATTMGSSLRRRKR
jgi:carbon storage regulator